MLARRLQNALLHIEYEGLAVTREELDLVLGRLVGAEQTVLFVAAAAVYGSVEDLVEVANDLCARLHEDALGARSGMDAAVDDVIGICEDRFRLICKNDLDLGTCLMDEVAVVLDIVHAGELVLVHAEQLAIACLGEYIRVGIDARSIQLVKGNQLVTDLIRGVIEHEHDLFRTHSDTAQTDRETVTRKDGADDTDGAAAEFGAYILGDVVHRRIVTLCACDDRLGDRNNVAVTECKSLRLRSFQHAGCNNCRKVITLADNGAADTSRYRADSSFVVCHNQLFFLYIKL